MGFADDHLLALLDVGLGNNTYLVDLGDGRALAVDASRDLRALHAAVRRRGLRVCVGALVGLERTTVPLIGTRVFGLTSFWRDIGYAVGALIAGILADAFGLNATVVAAAVLTAASGLLAARWITEHHLAPPPDETALLEGQ